MVEFPCQKTCEFSFASRTRGRIQDLRERETIFTREVREGAIEYLLMLAAVLVIVAVAVAYVLGIGGTPKPNILLSVEVNKVGEDNYDIRLVGTGGTDTCPASDWQYAIYPEGESPTTWKPGTTELSSTTDTHLETLQNPESRTYRVRVQHKPSGSYFVDTKITIP